MSDNLNKVEISKIVGKELNSSGLSMNITVIKIKTEKVIEIASIKSRINGDSGKISMASTKTSASAITMSPRKS